MDLTAFADEVGADGPGDDHRARHARRPGRRACASVGAPAGIDWIQPAEMTVSLRRRHDGRRARRRARWPTGSASPSRRAGTVGGALAVGRSGVRRLGYGPVRDAVLQARYVSAAGEVVKAGGPTVKNVSGFDLCRLLVGSRGTLGFLGDVILRTRPRARYEQWFSGPRRSRRACSPGCTGRRRCCGTARTTWVLLEGDERDVEAQVAALGAAPAGGPPPLPTGGRWSIPPGGAPHARRGTFVAEIGVGIVHHDRAAAAPGPSIPASSPCTGASSAVRPDRPAQPRRRRARCLDG